MMINHGLIAYLVQDEHVALVRLLGVVGEHEVASPDRIRLHDVDEGPCTNMHAYDRWVEWE